VRLLLVVVMPCEARSIKSSGPRTPAILVPVQIFPKRSGSMCVCSHAYYITNESFFLLLLSGSCGDEGYKRPEWVRFLSTTTARLMEIMQGYVAKTQHHYAPLVSHNNVYTLTLLRGRVSFCSILAEKVQGEALEDQQESIFCIFLP